MLRRLLCSLGLHKRVQIDTVTGTHFLCECCNWSLNHYNEHPPKRQIKSGYHRHFYGLSRGGKIRAFHTMNDLRFWISEHEGRQLLLYKDAVEQFSYSNVVRVKVEDHPHLR